MFRKASLISLPAGPASRSERASRGFTLLELVLVIAIVSILAFIVKPTWDTARRKARETTLISNLHVIRAAISQYVADRGKLPDTLDALVTHGYIGVMPLDPVAETRTWHPDFGRLPDSGVVSESGIIDVHSTSDATAIDGTIYNTW